MRRPANLEATSTLGLGATGHLSGEPFTLAGRRCIQGHRGQIWNEWKLKFDRVRPPAFLVESWGTFTVLHEGSIMTTRETAIGEIVKLPWVLVERGVATRLATWGEVDEGPETFEYSELSLRATSSTVVASVVDGDTFVGGQRRAEELGLTPSTAMPALVPAPNVSMPGGLELWLDIGDAGLLDGVEYRVLGIVARRTDDARWEDYLLYHAHVGLRWLSVSEGHWTYVTPVHVGALDFELPKPFGAPPARLEWAAGELPWSAEIAETVHVSEHDDIVIEVTAEDMAASRAIELTPDAVAKAFHKRSLPRPK
jgi:hypothetical protein